MSNTLSMRWSLGMRLLRRMPRSCVRGMWQKRNGWKQFLPQCRIDFGPAASVMMAHAYHDWLKTQ